MLHVHADEVGTRGGTAEHLVIALRQSCPRRRRRHSDSIDFTVLHCHGKRVVVGEGGERHAIELRRAVPVRLVGLHDDMIFGNKFDLLVGARAGRVVRIVYAIAHVVHAQ